MPTRPISELIGTQIAAAAHGHVVADVAGLQTALDGKQPVGSYADAVHAHAEYQPVGSYATADHLHSGIYAAAGHDHAGVYQPAGSYALATHDHAGVYQPAGSYAAASHTHPSSEVTGLGTSAARNIHVGTTAPANPAVGDLWVDTN